MPTVGQWGGRYLCRQGPVEVVAVPAAGGDANADAVADDAAGGSGGAGGGGGGRGQASTRALCLSYHRLPGVFDASCSSS